MIQPPWMHASFTALILVLILIGFVRILTPAPKSLVELGSIFYERDHHGAKSLMPSRRKSVDSVSQSLEKGSIGHDRALTPILHR